MNLKQAKLIAADTGRLATLIDVPYEEWAHNCHSISLKLLKTGEFGTGRIARGWANGVRGQHSWIVLGNYVYDPRAIIVDPTIWSYVPDIDGIVVLRNMKDRAPHGAGSIYDAAKPAAGDGKPIELTPVKPFSRAAQSFLAELGPLDMKGWMQLANSPVQGWPAKEILTAMVDSKMGVYVPIDILGMVTDLNPKGLYK